jgi:peptidoglycan hydrolase-like protein with peptidoglycan-binding domain
MKFAKKLGSRITALALAGMMTGCAISPRDNINHFERIPTENTPVVPPVRSISSFSDGLQCMDRMLRDYRVPQTLVTSKIIPDASGKVSVGTKEMVITALSVMSRTSGTFRYVDYEVDALRQDTVQNLTTLLMNAGQMRLQKPQLYISGSVAFMDQNVSVSRMGGGISARNWESGYSRDFIGTVFGMELHLGDFATRTLLPGVDSANQIVVSNAAHGFDVGGRIRKTGVQFNFSREISQGTGTAVRTLVELGVIELVGKWARVPYWQCLALDQAHPEYQAQMRAWWEDMAADERMRLFQNALRSSGYFNGAVDGKPSAQLKDAVMRYQADQHVGVTGNVNYETYERLAKDYVHFDGAGHFIRVGWGHNEKRTAAAKAGVVTGPVSQQIIDSLKPRNERPAIDAPTGRPPQVTVLLSNRDGEYTVGENMSYSVMLDRQAFVYCYYMDSRRQVSQIYPNPLQRAQPMRGNAAVQVPDMSNPNTFTIEFDQPGRQELACFATDQEIITKLPPLLRGPALQPLQGVRSLEEMQRAFTTAQGEAKFGVARVNWVINKR